MLVLLISNLSITAKGDGLCIGFVTFILLPAYAGKGNGMNNNEFDKKRYSL